MIGFWRGILKAGLVLFAMVPAWAEKPAGGICECGDYAEVPALCRLLSGTERDACITANTQWTKQCTVWRSAVCRAPVPISQPPIAAVAAPSSLAKYTGSWMGKVVCPRLGSWRLSLSVKPQADGAYLTGASTEGAGEFIEIALKDDSVSLLYVSWIKKVPYTGRLTSANRIEGKAHINTDDCIWYLAR
jgi:hypothetical protein